MNGRKRKRDETQTELLEKRKRQRNDSRALGRIKSVHADKNPPFGFIMPEAGAPELYFNERLLAEDLNWVEFLKVIDQYDDRRAPVMFKASKSAEGNLRAELVMPLSREQLKELDKDSDGYISRKDALRFFEAHPDLGMHTLRDLLYQKQQEAEDKLWKQYKAMRNEAAELRKEGQQLWANGQKQDAKAKHIKAKELQKQADELRRDITDLDWKHNQEMFEFVQNHQHKGETRDGTWIDLHGLTAQFAEHKALECLVNAQVGRIKHVVIITGSGIHSGRGGPAIKPKILNLLRHPPDSLGSLSFDEINAGAYRVTLCFGCTCIIS